MSRSFCGFVMRWLRPATPSRTPTAPATRPWPRPCIGRCLSTCKRSAPDSLSTANTAWSARTIAELYRARWTIELFFKELKQTLQLRDFVGTNEKAVKWQVWTGLLTHLLLRFLRHISRWGHSFSRCVGIVRSALWVKIDLVELLTCYGTAHGPHRPVLYAEEHGPAPPVRLLEAEGAYTRNPSIWDWCSYTPGYRWSRVGSGRWFFCRWSSWGCNTWRS